MPDSRDLYKTKLCSLYQRGNCHRQTCSFAHGQDELRKPPGRSGYYRDSRGYRDRRQGFERRSYDRGTSDSRSPHRRHSSRSLSSPSPRSPRSTGQKRSGSTIDRGEGEVKKPKGDEVSEVRAHGDAQAHSDGKEVQSNTLSEQLHMTEADVEALNGRKMHLEATLQNALQDKQRLSARNADLESKLAEAIATNKRFERFQKAFTRYIRCQEDMKRSEAKLQKLVDEVPHYFQDRREFPDPMFEGDHDNNHNKWRNRSSNGDVPVVNGHEDPQRRCAPGQKLSEGEPFEKHSDGDRFENNSVDEKHSAGGAGGGDIYERLVADGYEKQSAGDDDEKHSAGDDYETTDNAQEGNDYYVD